MGLTGIIVSAKIRLLKIKSKFIDTQIIKTKNLNDTIIKFKEFNNTSVGDYPVGNYEGAVVHGQYCTVGIENHFGNIGLEYTFDNHYPESNMELFGENEGKLRTIM